MTHYTVQFNSAIPKQATVSSLEQERFQGTLEDWRGTHQLEFCWQPVPIIVRHNAGYNMFRKQHVARTLADNL